MERRLAAVLAADMVGFSRLIEGDEDGVLSRQKAHRKSLIDPEIARYRGNIVKTTGDGMLAEFSSAQDAVRCAIGIQSGMIEREARQQDESRIQYRVGINLGDVVFDDGDIFGDGVNVAARLEGLAEPGGICISDIVHQTMGDRVDTRFRDMGGQRVKNISRPIKVWQWTPETPEVRATPDIAHQQRVQFCTSEDRTKLAWASVGEGPQILKAPNYMNHIEYEWTSPIQGPWINEIAQISRFVRFDQRGNGLSDWEVETISTDAMIADMEAVVDASGLDRFGLFGISQGAVFSVQYAARHPERVSFLIVTGGYLRGRMKRNNPEAEKFYNASRVMMEEGWGSTTPVYRNFFTSTFHPDASIEHQKSFDELQRISCSPENALRIWEMNNWVDVTDIAPTIEVPTLVLHNTGDRVVPADEGRLIAKLIPGAQFVELPGNTHIPTEGNPDFDMFFDEVRAFLDEHGT